MRPRLEMKSPFCACAIVASAASVFLYAEFFVDPVLLRREPENQDNEDDERSLRGEVEAERESEDDDFVERRSEEMNDEAEEKPDRQRDPHQVPGLGPVRGGPFRCQPILLHVIDLPGLDPDRPIRGR